MFFCFKALAQNNFNALGESAVSINHVVSNKYSTNFTLRSRYFLYQNEMMQYTQQQMDVYHFSILKLNQKSKIGLGVYYRNRDLFDSGSDEIRFTEEFNYAKRNKQIRYGHRFRSEQRILEKLTSFRQRYRFSIDLLLNRSQEEGTPYFIAAIEGLISFSKTAKPETDLRPNAQIGWQFSQGLKLQTGLEYRLEAFNISTKNNLFILTSAICKL